ncbi:hypothetical protein ACFQL4_10590 [Halosimplex aquaticum]
MTDSPTEAPASAGPSAVAPPANYTVDTVDPDGNLSETVVEDAWRTAWSSAEVREHFDDGEPVRFDVWAPVSDDDEVSVWVARNETAPTRVVADVDPSTGSVIDVGEPEVRTANESVHVEVTETAIESAGNGTFEVEVGTATDAAENAA